MDWLKLYIMILWSGVLLILGSLATQSLQWFAVIFSVGVICVGFSMVEMTSIKKQNVLKRKDAGGFPGLAPVNKLMPSGVTELRQGKKGKRGWLSFLGGKEHDAPVVDMPRVDTSFLPREEKETQPQGKVQLPQDVKVVQEEQGPLTDEQRKFLLHDYLQHAMKEKVPKAMLKETALQNHWPEEVFEQLYQELTAKEKKRKITLILSLMLVLVISTIVISKKGWFLVPYWVKMFNEASPIVYIGAIIILGALIVLFAVGIRKVLKQKRIEYKVEEEKSIEDLKQSLQKYSVEYQTDLDRLYKVVEEKGKVTVEGVAKAFNIKKEQAEEWGKILQDQELVTMHYPTVGEPEIIWRKLKSTTSP